MKNERFEAHKMRTGVSGEIDGCGLCSLRDEPSVLSWQTESTCSNGGRNSNKVQERTFHTSRKTPVQNIWEIFFGAFGTAANVTHAKHCGN